LKEVRESVQQEITKVEAGKEPAKAPEVKSEETAPSIAKAASDIAGEVKELAGVEKAPAEKKDKDENRLQDLTKQQKKITGLDANMKEQEKKLQAVANFDAIKPDEKVLQDKAKELRIKANEAKEENKDKKRGLSI
jgi:hypothetical protein